MEYTVPGTQYTPIASVWCIAVYPGSVRNYSIQSIRRRFGRVTPLVQVKAPRNGPLTTLVTFDCGVRAKEKPRKVKTEKARSITGLCGEAYTSVMYSFSRRLHEKHSTTMKLARQRARCGKGSGNYG